MKANDIITILQERIALLERLGDSDVAGFAVVLPPGGESILSLAMGAHVNLVGFAQELGAALKGQIDAAGYGGVGAQGYTGLRPR